MNWTLNPIPLGGGGGGADSTRPQIIFLITSIRDAAEPQNLLTFHKLNGKDHPNFFLGKILSKTAKFVTSSSLHVSKQIVKSTITWKEHWDALNAMKSGRSPVNDSLTKEFYVCFFNEICSPLKGTLSYLYEVGQLFTSQRQALNK